MWFVMDEQRAWIEMSYDRCWYGNNNNVSDDNMAQMVLMGSSSHHTMIRIIMFSDNTNGTQCVHKIDTSIRMSEKLMKSSPQSKPVVWHRGKSCLD